MTKLIAFALLTLGLGVDVAAQNLFANRRTQGRMIDDLTATNIGDIVTILIDEEHQILNEDKVQRDNSTTLAARLEAYSLSTDTFKENISPRIDVRQNREFDGNAKQEKDSRFRARLSVMVIDVLPNGNMVLAGSRIIEIDDETKTLRISGVIRRPDVTSDNTVASSLVANARVSIQSDGANTRMTSRGPIATLVDTLIWAAWPF